MRIAIEGLNEHHKWKIKKPLGGRNSFVRRAASKPLPTILGAATFGATGAGIGAGVSDIKGNEESKTNDYNSQVNQDALNETLNQDEFTRLGQEEERRKKALGLQQQGQINAFADEFSGKAKTYRNQLAATLANQNLESFKLANPHILEDLNSRGLFTSASGVNQAQTDALKELELDRQSKLMDFDTNAFSQENDIRGNGLSALLGGDQSALDSALEMQRAKLQRTFDVADENSRRRTAEYLAKKRSRDELVSSLVSGGANLASAYLSGGRSYLTPDQPQRTRRPSPN